MVKSMTAFARGTAASDGYEISWEVKTVNHRYLDISLRLPEELRLFEMKARELIQQRLGRGKLEAACRYQLVTKQQTQLTLDADKVAAVIAACNEIEMQMGMGQALNALDILRYPGVVNDQQIGVEYSEQVVIGALSSCLDELQQSRSREGERMAQLILERAGSMAAIVASVRKRRPQVIEAVQNKLRQRLQELADKADNDRLEQELVLIAQKMDVDEELDRLDSHLNELQDVFKRQEPIGRRLDFLMQEFNREANTLGSKSADVETTQAAVELKVLIEQMREQVQNIE